MFYFKVQLISEGFVLYNSISFIFRFWTYPEDCKTFPFKQNIALFDEQASFPKNGLYKHRQSDDSKVNTAGS